MLEEESSQPTEAEEGPIDVKAKLAQMSGTRLLQEQAERKAAAQQRSDPPKKKKKKKKAVPAPETETAPDAEPVVAVPATTEAKPAKPKAKAKPAKAKRTEASTTSLPAPVALLLGVLAGCIPGIVFLVVQTVTTPGPTNLPAEAVERQGDWIHCPKAEGASRWTCDVYDFAGNVIGHGQFVPSTANPVSDWRALARQKALVPDGSYEARNARSVILYVRGVAVGSKPAPRSK